MLIDTRYAIFLSGKEIANFNTRKLTQISTGAQRHDNKQDYTGSRRGTTAQEQHDDTRYKTLIVVADCRLSCDPMAPPQPPARAVPSRSPILSSPKASVPAPSVDHGMLPPPKPTKTSSLPPVYPRSSAKRALPGTKKPRSKRAKQADNRSTITTTTDTAKRPVNVYDAVLGEAEDLLQAANQAQALGRLKMASAYQLLLHARLVGLGKRFDRAIVEDPPPPPESPDDSTSTSAPGTPAAAGTPAAGEDTPPPSVQELSKYLPSHIELDSTMMEHLARVAMELHHQKTGRKIHSDTPTPPPSKSTVAWTEAEKQQCQVLLDQGLTEYDISQRMKSRTEAQVRAYLQNQKQRAREARAVEQDFDEENTPRKKGRGRKPPTQAMNTVPNANLDAKKLLSGKALG